MPIPIRIGILFHWKKFEVVSRSHDLGYMGPPLWESVWGNATDRSRKTSVSFFVQLNSIYSYSQTLVPASHNQIPLGCRTITQSLLISSTMLYYTVSSLFCYQFPSTARCIQCVHFIRGKKYGRYNLMSCNCVFREYSVLAYKYCQEVTLSQLITQQNCLSNCCTVWPWGQMLCHRGCQENIIFNRQKLSDSSLIVILIRLIQDSTLLYCSAIAIAVKDS